MKMYGSGTNRIWMKIKTKTICTLFLLPRVGWKKANKYLIVMDEEQIDFYFNGTAFPINQTIMIHIVLGCLCKLNMKAFLKD